MDLNKAQYGRVKGAEWFPYLYKKEILVLGQGGIGSWTSLLLSRIGCALYLFDHDSYEEHNMTGQVVRKKDIGKNKALAAKDLISEFSPDATVDIFGKYEEDSFTNDIVLCGFDNMAARKLSFRKWVEHVNSGDTDPKECLFIDGRLNAEMLQVLCIPGDRKDLIQKYAAEYLFSDESVPEQECTFKQTSHCAAMIASFMVTYLTNWTVNVINGMEIRQVPFFFEYIPPLNMITNVKS